MRRKKKRERANNLEELTLEKNIFLEKSICGITKMLSEGRITPEEIAEECLKRIEKYNDKYNVFVIYDRENLLKQAEKISQRIKAGNKIRRLEGIPAGIKDIFNTYDFPTQMGSPLWKNFTSGNDSRVIFYLKQEGAVIPGKTDTAEFAVHAIGNCLNPHDITKTPGTSSSGSAVAVSLGMVPFSIGTQTAGSIVRPASFCGVYGCKPSFGLIPRTGMLKTTDSLDTIGFFASKYEDIETIFDIMRVHGSNYPLSHKALTDEVRQNKKAGSKWRVKFAKTHTWDFAPDYAKKEMEDFIEKISATDDIEMTDTKLPAVTERSHDVHQMIYDKTLSYYFQEEFKKPEFISPVMREIFDRGNKITVEQYHKSLRDQEIISGEVDKYFECTDIIISLSTAGEAPAREESEEPDPSLMWTLSHLPVVSCPVFVSPSGLPYGVQIAARKYNDLLLFRFTDHLRKNGLIPEGVNPVPNI
ncbi:MAG TPA: amidase [Ignavibacteria bacterium]|nr:amidase [Ignavibacteria bacterium]HRJ98496.1 amidase [Ignavibacteria bacterium]